MAGKTKKIQTDNDVKKKAVKLVVAHLKKKIPNEYFSGKESLEKWIADMEEMLKESEFNLVRYFDMRSELNSVIEGGLEGDMKFKIRDSWYSFGKALNKKLKLD